MHWIVCKHPATYTSHHKPSNSISWTSILSLSHYSHTSNAIQNTFSLTHAQQNLYEPNTSSFTQLLSAPFSTNLLDSQTFDATEDQPQPYLRTLAVKPTSSAQPDKLELTAKSDLPNKELGPFNEDKDKVLHNQPQEDDEE